MALASITGLNGVRRLSTIKYAYLRRLNLLFSASERTLSYGVYLAIISMAEVPMEA